MSTDDDSALPQADAAAPWTAPGLARVTVAFDDTEDRISLTGLAEGGDVQLIWLTRRLLDRLVPHLCQWLEAREPVVRAALMPRMDVMHTMAQQRAVSALVEKHEQPVPRSPATHSWLAGVIDVRATEQRVTLLLRTESRSDQVQLGMQAVVLRQWLAIVLQQYRRAGWPLDAWPQWMVEALSQPESADAVVLH